MKKIYWAVILLTVLILAMFGIWLLTRNVSNVGENLNETDEKILVFEEDTENNKEIAQINIDSDYGREINEELKEIYETETPEIESSNFSDICSITLKRETSSGEEYYQTYNIDSVDGQKVDSAKLLSTYEIKDRDYILSSVKKYVLNKLNEDAKKMSGEERIGYVDKYYKLANEYIKNQINEGKEILRINENGKLEVITKIYGEDEEKLEFIEVTSKL